jgi:hypothetical protein
VLILLQASQAVRLGAGVGDGVPVRDAGLGRPRRHAGLSTGHDDGEVVAESFVD